MKEDESERKKTKNYECGWKWRELDGSGSKWIAFYKIWWPLIKLVEIGCMLRKVDKSGWKWMKVDESV